MSVVFVFTGPSGAGKTTILSRVLKKFESKAERPVTCTTRQARAGEVDGVNYHFISRARFYSLIESDEFLEHTTCHENMYGTLKHSIYSVLENKQCCVLEYDYRGAYNILHNDVLDVEVVGVAIFPSSIKQLRVRLYGRGSETKETMDIRLSAAFNQPLVPNFRHVIINKDVNESVDELYSIMKLYVK
jgi:guanylate kinase